LEFSLIIERFSGEESSGTESVRHASFGREAVE
jgi:hypothetical protein